MAFNSGSSKPIELIIAVHHKALKISDCFLVACSEGGQEQARATLSLVNQIALSGDAAKPISMIASQLNLVSWRELKIQNRDHRFPNRFPFGIK